MNRIAIVGISQVDRIICAHVLSEILKKTYIASPSFDNVFQEIYQKKVDSKYSFSEIYTVGLFQFHSRFLAEKCQNFISDGSVLDEVVFRKLIKERKGSMPIKCNMKYLLLKKSYIQFGEKIEHLIEDYFINAYDKIYLFVNENCYSIYTHEYENALKVIMDRNNIPYKLISGNKRSFISEVLIDQRVNGYEIAQIEQLINKYKHIIY